MALLFVLIAFLAIILIRAAAFKPMKEINAKRKCGYRQRQSSS